MDKTPDNVIKIDFRKIIKERLKKERLDDNPFSIFIDEASIDPEEFSKSLLSSSTENSFSLSCRNK